MHGTQLNGRRIVAREDVPLSPGDVLSFGNKVSRGEGRYGSHHLGPCADSSAESFFPVDVRFDCRWHGYVLNPYQPEGRSYTNPTSPTTEHRSTMAGAAIAGTNTYSVPDDDDDSSDDEVLDTGSRSVRKARPTIDSDSESVSEDSNHALNTTSPATSPEAEAKQKPERSGTENGDTSAPPAAPGAFPDFPEPSGDVESRVNEDSDNESEFEVSNDSGVSSTSESEDDHQAGDDNDGPANLTEMNSPPPASPWLSAAAAPAEEPKSFGNSRPSYTSQPGPRDSVLSSQPPNDCMYPPDMTQTKPAAAAAGYQPPWLDFNFRVPSPSDKAMAKPASHHNFGYPELPATFDPWAVPYPSSINSGAYRPGPMSSRLQQLEEPFAYTTQRPLSQPSASTNVANANASPILPHATDAGRSDAASMQPKSDESKVGESTGSTRLAISDIVDKLSSEGHPAGPSNPLKRKAAEYEADLGESTNRVDESQDDSFPDAQPQPDLSAISVAESQLREIKSLVEQRQAAVPEHRCKRAKAGVSFRSIAKYVGVAAVGAVIGSITTIATLSALPAEYFEQR